MMEYVDRNMPHLGAVGLFYREFMGFLMTADPQTAILLAASIQWNQSAKAIVTIPFDV